jgi:hypothetical protein
MVLWTDKQEILMLMNNLSPVMLHTQVLGGGGKRGGAGVLTPVDATAAVGTSPGSHGRAVRHATCLGRLQRRTLAIL